MSGNVLSPKKALFILILAVAIILVGIAVFKVPAVVCLITAGMTIIFLGMIWGCKWDDIEEDIKNTAKTMFGSILILMFVGMLVGSWMLSGTVPFMMYYGLKILPPSIFLVATTILCALMSIMTGTSWGTMSTLGVALMGVSVGLGIPLPYTAGAIISGAIFGDKLSPLSDTTILAPAVSGVDIIDHIKTMLYSTIPGFTVGIIMYFIIGIKYSGSGIGGENYELILATLAQNFNMNPILMLPPIVVLVLIYRRKPALPVFAIGIALGAIFAAIFQGSNLSEVANALNRGYTASTGIEIVDKMIQRGGINSMMGSVALIIGAAVFGAPLKTTGIIDVLIDALQRYAKSRKTLLGFSYLLHLFMYAITGAYYVTFSIIGPILRPLYDEYDLNRANLSRMLEDTGTAFGPLIPWSNVGVFCATTLGVSTGAYALYAPITYLSLVFPLIYIITGFGIFNSKGEMLIKLKKAAGK